MSKIIFGSSILKRGLLQGASESNLKNSTYDLTIGEIFPLGQSGVELRRRGLIQEFTIGPSQMVLVMSKERFNLPSTVTGIATLRTSFTKMGILALNVGVIDPHYKGPISAALINFSDRNFQISIRDKFFRVLFLEHDETSDYKPQVDEGKDFHIYRKELIQDAVSKFPTTYLNIPTTDPDFLARNFRRSAWLAITKIFQVFGYFGWLARTAALVFVAAFFWYAIFETGFIPYYKSILDSILGFLRKG